MLGKGAASEILAGDALSVVDTLSIDAGKVISERLCT